MADHAPIDMMVPNDVAALSASDKAAAAIPQGNPNCRSSASNGPAGNSASNIAAIKREAVNKAFVTRLIILIYQSSNPRSGELWDEWYTA
eukprot:265314-Amorphochlora_amoeboformis.AAC.1